MLGSRSGSSAAMAGTPRKDDSLRFVQSCWNSDPLWSYTSRYVSVSPPSSISGSPSREMPTALCGNSPTQRRIRFMAVPSEDSPPLPNNLPMGLIRFRPHPVKPGQCFVSINQHCKTMMNTTAENIVDFMNLNDDRHLAQPFLCRFVHPEDWPVVLRLESLIISGADTEATAAFRLITSDRRHVPSIIRAKLTRDENGRLVEVIGCLMEIPFRNVSRVSPTPGNVAPTAIKRFRRIF